MGRKLTVGARGNQALSQWQVKFTKTLGKEELEKMNKALGVFQSGGKSSRGPHAFTMGPTGATLQWKSAVKSKSVYDWFLRLLRGTWDEWQIIAREDVPGQPDEDVQPKVGAAKVAVKRRKPKKPAASAAATATATNSHPRRRSGRGG